MMNDDDFLTQHREEPRPQFARDLYGRISGRAAAPETGERPALRQAWKSAIAASVAAAAAVGLLAFPGVRAAAQDFLDMFRVKKFVAVPISPERVAALSSGRVDVESLLSDSVEVTKKGGPPRVVASAEDAARETGIPVLVPTYVFNLNEAPEIRVLDSRAARFTANASRLQAVAETLGVNDVEVPAQLDGATVEVRVPAAVAMRYQRNGVWVATFTQGRSPEIDLPAGVDLAKLGEIGL